MLLNCIICAISILGITSVLNASPADGYITDTVLMVPPYSFKYNYQIDNNNYQHNTFSNPQMSAKYEFERMLNSMKANHIKYILLENKNKRTPDAIFVGDWVSFHKTTRDENILVVYPMFSKNRQREKQTYELLELLEKNNIAIDEIFDLSNFELDHASLEGLGSVVFDRKSNTAFVSLSIQSHLDVIEDVCNNLKCKIITFSSQDEHQKPIYHTNLMLSINNNFAVLCAECIKNIGERAKVINELTLLNKEIIYITSKQTKDMCGNVLELQDSTKLHKTIILMSTRAFSSFTTQQKTSFLKYGKIVELNIPTIETIGGRGVNSLIVEVFE